MGTSHKLTPSIIHQWDFEETVGRGMLTERVQMISMWNEKQENKSSTGEQNMRYEEGPESSAVGPQLVS